MNITATAHRWKQGWELRIDGETVTQTKTLGTASEQVRDYLDTVDPETDHALWHIEVVPDLGELNQQIQAARQAIADAAAANARAARQNRDIVRQLREAGLSVTDTAAALGVSRGRVSQLTKV